MQKRTLLDNRHPDYLRKAADWQFWQQAYDNDDNYRQAGHLFRFPRENAVHYQERLRRSSRMNFTRQVLDLLLQYLSKEAPLRQTRLAPQRLLEFWENADRKHASMTQWMHGVSIVTALFGHCYIVVDKPTTLAATRQAETEQQLIPYAYCVSPLDLLDWVEDTGSGALTQALIRETVRGPINLAGPREDDDLQTRYRLWLKTDSGVEWILFQTDVNGQPVIAGRGIAGISEIPIVCVTRTGGSLIGDIAALDRKIYNYESLLDQILYDQTFSTLRLPWTGSTESFYEAWELTLGTKSILPYDPGTGATPDFIAPDASQGALILNAIEQSINRIYQSRNLLDTVGTVQSASTPASGVARGYDFEKLNAVLSAFADDLEQAEQQIARLVLLWDGDTTPLPTNLVDYPDTFDTQTLLQTLEECRQLSQSVHSATFQTQLQQKLVKLAAPKLNAETQQRIDSEIQQAEAPSQ